MIVPHITPKLDLCGSVAIVGSSAKLLESRHGKHIDGFDNVIRFNRAPTKGYEEIAGSKTTLRVISNHVFMSKPFKRWEEDNIFVKKLRNTKLLLARDQYLVKQRNDFIDSSIELYSIQGSLESNIKNTTIKKLPTVGFMGIFLMVLAGIKPTVFGWSTTIDEPMSHYFNRRSSTVSQYHNWGSEIYEIGQLIDNNKIKIET